jgi:hypothetical protein
MPKKPKIRSVVSRKKRPKSVYSRGWETRRRNQEALRSLHLTSEGHKAFSNKIVKGLQQAVATTGLVTQSPSDDHSNDNRREVSAGDAILRTVMIHRDEQLCCFVAEMMTLRRQGVPSHAPMMVSRSQCEAIEDLLAELGYSMFGKGSGASSVVSNKPTA